MWQATEIGWAGEHRTKWIGLDIQETFNTIFFLKFNSITKKFNLVHFRNEYLQSVYQDLCTDI